MKTADFEFAIKQDVRNNPIVRQIDEDRQRELWRSVAIGGLLVGVLLVSAGQHFELLRYGYRLGQLQEQRRAEEAVNRHLKVEVEALKSPRRIERIATQQLRLATPGRGESIVIERVTPPEPPPGSVVAAR
jgi:cell division protein FtsL